MSKLNSKIWLVISESSYLRKQKIYRTESALLKAINPNSSQEIIELDVVSITNPTDFLKERNRDSQLRSVLGELDTKEEAALKLIAHYKEFAPDGGSRTISWRTKETKTEKEIMIDQLEKYQTDKKSFANILIQNKKHFITSITSVEWYKLLLSCHNFNDYIYVRKTWIKDETLPRGGKYGKVDTATEEMVNNFKEAKKQLRKKEK